MKRSSLFIPAVALGVGLLLGGSHAAAEPSGVACRQGDFGVCFERGAITSLKRVGDTHDTDYLRAGGRFGDLTVRWRADNDPWQTIATQNQPEAIAATLTATFTL